MKSALGLLIISTVVIQIIANTVPLIPEYPSGALFGYAYYANPDLEILNSRYEGFVPTPVNTIVFHQQATDYFWSILNFEKLYMYNLDVENCHTDFLPLISNENRETHAMFDMQRIVEQYPCFRNGDRFVFAGTLKTSDAPSLPSLMQAVFRIDIDQVTHGFSRVYVKFVITQTTWEIIVNYRKFVEFLWTLEILRDEGKMTVEDCLLPTEQEIQSYKQIDRSVSGISMDYVDKWYEAFQVHFVPNRPGCSNTGPITLYNSGNKPITFPDDCYGTAYVTWVQRLDDMRPFCGARIPLKIPINPKALATRIHLPNSQQWADTYWLDDRCAVLPEQENLPEHEVGSVTVKRSTDDIKDTKIDQIRFYRDASCTGIWTPKNAPGSTDTISAMTLKYENPCLKTGDVVSLQYQLADACQGIAFPIQAKIVIDGSRNPRVLVIDFLGNEPETFLEAMVIVPPYCPVDNLATFTPAIQAASKISLYNTLEGYQSMMEFVMVPDRPGCPEQSRTKIVQGVMNTPIDASFPSTCYGLVYGTLLTLDEYGGYECGRMIPYSIVVNARAELQTIYVQNSPSLSASYWFTNIDRCIVLPQKSNLPTLEVGGSVTILRDTTNIGMTKMKKLIFNGDYCSAEYVVQNGTKGSSESFDFGQFFAAHQNCFSKNYPDITLQYTLESCDSRRAFFVEALVRYVPGNGKDLVLHFPGDRIETFLENSAEVINTPVVAKRALRTN